MGKLPKGYIQLEYIQSTGTQYIDTGVEATADVNADFTLQLTGDGTNDCFLEVYGGTTGTCMTLWYAYQSKVLVARGGTGYTTTIAADKNIHNVSVKTTEIIIDGTSYSVNGGGSANYNYYLFCENSKGSATVLSKYRLYGISFSKNNVLIRDYIPCISESGEVGLYDLVNKQFYGNSGTGYFLPGPAVVSLPKGYTKLEYIRSTGTQYINSGFSAKPDTKIVLDVSDWPESNTATSLLGAMSSSADRYDLFLNSSRKYVYAYGGSLVVFSDASASDKTTIILDENVATIGETSVTNAVADFTMTTPLYLLARNDSGSATRKASAKLYSCQIYDNGTLVRDYAPCLNPSNDVGLYDIVNGVFYGNAGSGYFLPGPAVSLPEGYTRLEYIESSGTQWINTKYAVTSQNIRYALEFSAASIIGTVPVGGGATNGYFPAIHQQNTSSGVRVWVGSTGALCQFTLVANQKTIVDLTANNGSLSVTFDGTTQTASYSGSISSASAPSLFNQNASSSATQFATMKLYGFTLYDNDDLVRLYIPALNENGEAGLYDHITGEFYSNDGTGTFVSGAKLIYPEVLTSGLDVFCKINNVWKYVNNAYVKIDGHWKTIDTIAPIIK